MKLVFHGGKCCALKTIHGFEYSPTDKLSGVAKKPATNVDQNGGNVSSDKDFFTDEAPQETYVERLDRLIAFCQKNRPYGIIEVCLATSPYPCYNQITIWEPLLLERGFKAVASCFNSNSGNRVTVYYLISDKG
jgi:hypothetical protein